MARTVTMMSLRTFTLRSTSGHCVHFEKQKPKEVPGHLVKECMAQGCAPVDDLDLPDDDEVTKVEKTIPQGLDREELIQAALENIIRENDRDDFTSAGQPNIKRLEKRLGFDVSKQEIIPMWDELRATGE